MNGTFNRQYKDTLFRIIFGEHKENALVLYNAINGTEYSDEEQPDTYSDTEVLCLL